jgi:hypothetical protein
VAGVKNHLKLCEFRETKSWLETHNFISVHDGLKSVRYNEASGVLWQLSAQGSLNDRVRFVIYGS